MLSTPPETGEVSAVRPIAAPTSYPAADQDASKPRIRAVPRRQSVRPLVVAPTRFNQAQDVADNFKAGKAVAMDLSGADGDLARRLIDFSSGLCYGIGGTMQRLERSSVYLILPVGVEVPEQERALLLGSTDEDL